MKRATFAFAFFLWSISLSGMRAFAEEKSLPKPGGTLTVLMGKRPSLIHPHRVRRGAEQRFLELLLEGLVDTDKNLNIVPALATSWKISDDGKDYTFQLRRGVKFHNGRELEAEDVRWSFENMMDPKAARSERTALIRGIELLDRYTVRFHLKSAFTPFLSGLDAYSPIIPKESWPTAAGHPVGTGPFQFAEWKQGDLLRVKRFKDYWQKGIPYVDEVIWKEALEAFVRMTAIRSGSADIAEELPEPNLPQMLKDPSIRVFTPQSNLTWVYFNTTKSPFDDLRARQAVAYAIDKEAVMSQAAWGYGEIVNQRYPRTSFWHVDVEDPFRKPNLDKARALLRDAGYTKGLRISSPVYPDDIQEATVIQSDLKKIGIDIQWQMTDYAGQKAREEKLDFTLNIGGGPVTSDPHLFYYARFHSKGDLHSKGVVSYTSPQMDQLLDSQLVVTDQKKRKEVYTQIVQMIQKEVPCIFLGTTPLVFGTRAGIHGFEPSMNRRLAYVNGGIAFTWIEK
jgi:peptide/nickel transport system substrate-binding protein